MNRQQKIGIIAIVFLIAGVFAFANTKNWWKKQENTNNFDAKEEFKQLLYHYSNLQSLNLSGVIRLYDAEQQNTVKEKTEFACIKSSSGIYSQLGQLQTFVWDSLTVQLDTVNKYIIISKQENAEQSSSTSNILPFEEFLKDTSSFKIEVTGKQQGSTRTLYIKSDLNPEIKSCSISYDFKTYQIKQAEIEWWKETLTTPDNESKKFWLTRIEYNYKSSSSFSVSGKVGELIKINGEEVEATEAYKDYQVQVMF